MPDTTYQLPTTYTYVKYIVKSTIGRPVILAKHKVLDEKHVVKLFLPDSSTDESIVYLEPRILKELNHNNVVPIFDAGHITETNHIWIATKYYEQGCLYNKRNDWKHWNTHQILSIIYDILHALEYVMLVHKTLHRDIKPANILLDKNEQQIFRALLTDFGNAAKMDSNSSCPPSVAVKWYMAPELSTGGRATVQSEIFSLGVILFELLQARTLSQSPSSVSHSSHRERHLQLLKVGKRPFEINNLPTHISKKLRELIKRATEPDLSKRYLTCAEFRKDADTALNHANILFSCTSDEISWTLLNDHGIRENKIAEYIITVNINGRKSSINAYKRILPNKKRSSLGKKIVGDKDILIKIANAIIKKTVNSHTQLEETLRTELLRFRT